MPPPAPQQSRSGLRKIPSLLDSFSVFSIPRMICETVAQLSTRCSSLSANSANRLTFNILSSLWKRKRGQRKGPLFWHYAKTCLPHYFHRHNHFLGPEGRYLSIWMTPY
ncbi:hypothetical protein M408DRAFT_229581 [Serendipita vermifera MAFF 305830]|uniref:Uncharacterized protein n=1 Tax=Serendipita vermifera MAFF 305830 TaxID=933852 RepID=A0A0C3AZX2_SERVB|nr:hypothetical protein M408DRAFT_229581 [Serendipita vermifera MAFF 305830]